MKGRVPWIILFLALALSLKSIAEESQPDDIKSNKQEPSVIYPKKTELDFDGIQVEGELRNPGEFYFQHRNQDQFDSLVKRRKNFHREMLRDAVLAR